VLSKSRPRTLNLIATYRELASRQISELPSETLLFVSCVSETCSPVGDKRRILSRQVGAFWNRERPATP
jgi:hypothetical protein